MDFGYLSFNASEGIGPAEVGRAVEERGFDSLWLPEHTHIPASRATRYPAGGDLTEVYYRIMDPLVSLMAAGAATEKIKLYTGICLLLQHDLIDLACSAATLDVLTDGRLRLGVGVGWNEEELFTHRPDLEFRLRYSAMRERVAALRAAWSPDPTSFEGRWDSFESSFVEPKPFNGTIPVSLGNAGAVGIRHAAEYGDEWAPIDGGMLNTTGRPNVRGAIEMFRELATDAGRDPDTIPITIHAASFNEARFETYRELGVRRIVLYPPHQKLISTTDTLRHLDGLGDFIAGFNG